MHSCYSHVQPRTAADVHARGTGAYIDYARRSQSKPQSFDDVFIYAISRAPTALVIIMIMPCAFARTFVNRGRIQGKFKENSNFQAPKKIFKDFQALSNLTLKIKHFQGFQGGVRTLSPRVKTVCACLVTRA